MNIYASYKSNLIYKKGITFYITNQESWQAHNGESN